MWKSFQGGLTAEVLSATTSSVLVLSGTLPVWDRHFSNYTLNGEKYVFIICGSKITAKEDRPRAVDTNELLCKNPTNGNNDTAALK